MITAEEARQLSGPSVEDYLEEAYAAIRKAAEAKNRAVNMHGDFWVNEGYNGTANWVKVRRELVSKGFIVDFFYEELQFVTMYTRIRW